jgi:short-subunit dehydrogenase
MKVQNKVIIVTGGGSGMGREIVLNLLSKGAKVAAIDINEVSLKETFAISKATLDSLGIFTVDITSRSSVARLSDEVVERFGHVDGIINNAGIIQPFIKLNDLAYETIERVISINLYGTLYMIKTFLPHLLTRPEAHIVNISSMGGFLPVPGQTIYGASKAAVKLLTEGLKSELADSNVAVTVVFPGAVNTNILKNSGINRPSSEGKSRKVLSSEKAAQIIVDGLENGLTRIFVGKDSKIMDYFYRINPTSAARMIGKKMKDLLAKPEQK